MESLLNNLVLLYEAQLAELEIHFDTTIEDGIKRSKNTLSEFFFALQKQTIYPDIFFEIGAFSATTSLALKEALPDTQCFAFEANVYNYDFFRQQYNYEEAGVNYINAAISQRTGKEKFYVQKAINEIEVEKVRANNSLLQRQQKNVEYEELEVDAYTIDSFIQSKGVSIDNKRISLWIDTEGAAFEVLRGMKAVLENVHSIFIEVEEKRYWKDQALAQQIIRYLLRAGFIPVARDFEAPFQYNILFIRAGIVHRPTYKTCRSDYFRSIGRHTDEQVEESVEEIEESVEEIEDEKMGEPV